jgi:cell filamentation protein
MQALEEEDYLSGISRATFVTRLSWYYGEINVLHPFRVGSGLVQRIFFEQLALHAGFVLDWRDIDPDSWSQANQLGRWAIPNP